MKQAELPQSQRNAILTGALHCTHHERSRGGCEVGQARHDVRGPPASDAQREVVVACEAVALDEVDRAGTVVARRLEHRCSGALRQR